jgi:PBP1b-binding outer membrane lipoprotein LpoB
MPYLARRVGFKMRKREGLKMKSELTGTLILKGKYKSRSDLNTSAQLKNSRVTEAEAQASKSASQPASQPASKQASRRDTALKFRELKSKVLSLFSNLNIIFF